MFLLKEFRKQGSMACRHACMNVSWERERERERERESFIRNGIMLRNQLRAV
jgi:hypothetical protein